MIGSSSMEQQGQAMDLDSDTVRPGAIKLQAAQAITSQRPSRNDCTEHHLFLPPEIRLRIWQQAFLSAPPPSKVYRSRVSIVTTKGSKVACFNPYPEVGDLTRQWCNLLGIDKQSRQEALRLQYVDMFLPFNYINPATKEICSGVFPYLDLASVFCMDMDRAAAMQLFAKDVQGTEVLQFREIEDDGYIDFVNMPNFCFARIHEALLYAYRYAFKNIQKLAIAPKVVYTRQKIENRRGGASSAQQLGMDVYDVTAKLWGMPPPTPAKIESWHDWTGLVKQDNVDFLESTELAFGEIERYEVSANAIFAEPWQWSTLCYNNEEELVLLGLRLDRSRLGPKDEGKSGPVVVVLPASEDLTDLLDSW